MNASQFTQAQQRLAAIVQAFRDDALPLEQALALFEEGVQQVRQCQQVLSQARGTFSQLRHLMQETELAQLEHHPAPAVDVLE